jgi:hypothetical protein
MVIGNRCGNIRAPDAVQAYSGIGRGGFKAREHCSSSSNAAVVSVYYAPVAQLDRAPGYEPGGREFESLRAHHTCSFQSKTYEFSCDQKSVEYRRVNLAMCPRRSQALASQDRTALAAPRCPSRLPGDSLQVVPRCPSLSLAFPGDSLAFPIPLGQSVHYEEGSTDRRARRGDDTAGDRSCRLDCYGARDLEGLSRAAGTAPTTRTAGRRPGKTPGVQELDVPW